MLPVVFHVPLLVLVSSAFSGLFFFSLFRCFRGSVLCLLVFPWGFSLFVRVQFLFFGFGFLFSVVFPFLFFWLTHLLLLSSIFWLSLILWGLLFRCFHRLLPLVFLLWSSLSACCGSGSSLWSLSEFFPHAVATVACFLSSSMFFRLLRFWLSLPISSPFSVCCVSFCSLVVFLVFPHLTPPPALPFCRTSGCLPCCGFFFGCTPVVRKLPSMLSAGFLSPNFLSASFFFLLPRVVLPWCLFLLVLVVLLCTLALVLSPPFLPCYVAVASVSLFSDSFESPVPVATWSPFWAESDWLRPLFFSV